MNNLQFPTQPLTTATTIPNTLFQPQKWYAFQLYLLPTFNIPFLQMNDCMEVKTFPKKANKMSIVRYDDIAAMHVKKVFTWYHICLAILTCYTIILPLLFLYAGSNHKLEITLKSGAKTSICASNKNVMTNFATELNQRIIKKCGHSVLI